MKKKNEWTLKLMDRIIDQLNIIMSYWRNLQVIVMVMLKIIHRVEF